MAAATDCPLQKCSKSSADIRTKLLGCPVDNLTMHEALDRIESYIRAGVPRQHVAINVRKVVAAYRDSDLHRVVEQCDLATADGHPILWVSRLFGTPLKDRVTGIDLMEHLLGTAAREGYRVYFLGARQEVLLKAVEHYQHLYPGLRIVGWSNGYWAPEEEEAVVATIRQAKPDILLVAMVSPKKEFFIHQHGKALQVPFSMGVGGAFDVMAGKFKRAPRWMQRNGLEWSWRFIQDPRRLWRRYLFDAFIFGFLVGREFLRRQPHGRT